GGRNSSAFSAWLALAVTSHDDANVQNAKQKTTDFNGVRSCGFIFQTLFKLKVTKVDVGVASV
ncbi:MAG: hypothetical protein AAB403_14950, partial [Planctomycetota bacterium]